MGDMRLGGGGDNFDAEGDRNAGGIENLEECEGNAVSMATPARQAGAKTSKIDTKTNCSIG